MKGWRFPCISSYEAFQSILYHMYFEIKVLKWYFWWKPVGYKVILSWGSKWVQVSTSLLPKNITIPVAPLERWVIFRIGGGSGVALLGATERSPFCNLHSSLDHPEDHWNFSASISWTCQSKKTDFSWFLEKRINCREREYL